MIQYKVGYLVGSLAKASINRLLAGALVRLAPAQLEMTEISFKDLPVYSYDYDANYPPVATAFKDAIAAVDAVLFVTPEYQPVHPGRPEECHRLGQPALRQERIRAESVRHHRYIAGEDRHGHCPAASAQHSRFLQLTADEFGRGVRAVRTRPHHRGRAGYERVHRAISQALHGRVCSVHRQGVYGAAAESVAAVSGPRPLS